MMTKIRPRRSIGTPLAPALLLTALALAGCAGADDQAGSESATSTGDGTSSVSASSTSGGSSSGSSSSGSSTSAASTSTSSSTSAASETSSSTGDGTTSTTGGSACVEPPFDPDPLGPQAAMCVSDAECADGDSCFNVPLLGGLCGECKTDADCPAGGCTPPDVLNGRGAVCNTGKPGGGCETDAACNSTCHNICAEVLDATPILVISTCSACQTSADCEPGWVCAPELDLDNFTGINECVPPGSLALGASCSLAGDGADACASGICGDASIMGIIKVGVCSECASDADCAPGELCTDASVDPNDNTLIPGTCG